MRVVYRVRCRLFARKRRWNSYSLAKYLKCKRQIKGHLLIFKVGRKTRVINIKEPFFLFDVRNQSDFADWKIEGEHIEYLNVPYFELIDGVEHVLERLPKDKKIIVVCAKEGSSAKERSSTMVADMLAEKGLEVFYLKGGMKAWSEYLYPVVAYEDENVKVYQFIRDCCSLAIQFSLAVSGDQT